MKRTKPGLLICVVIISCIATISGILSLSTNYWVQTDAISTIADYNITGKGNYGLYQGNWEMQGHSADIKITCLIKANICGWSFKSTNNEEMNEIESLYKQECKTSETKCDIKFLNAGMWISTLFFLTVALFLSLVTTIFVLLSILKNPSNDYLNVLGLKLWNGLASANYFLVLVLWGAEFATIITDNFGVYPTLIGALSTKGLATLSYSYWLLMVPTLLHIVNIIILFIRQHQINKEPTASTMNLDTNRDGVTFLY